MKSYAAEVIADNSGKWVGNGLRFATRQEAEDYVWDLSCRWTAVRETRVVESDDEVNEPRKRSEQAGTVVAQTTPNSEVET